LDIQELGIFKYTPLSVSLKPYLLSPCVCVINTYYSQRKKKQWDSRVRLF